MQTSTNSNALIDWPEADFSRIPYRVFYDSRIYAAEQQRIFRGPVWTYLCLEAEIPKPGDFKTTLVGDTPVIVNRARNGALAAMVNRCAHRGATVRRESFGNSFEHRCVYHQWCYDNHGALMGIPNRRGVEGKGGMPKDFDMAQHGLRRLNVASYRGLVFGSFQEAVEPLEEYLGEMARVNLDRVFHKPPKVLGYARQVLKANWKIYTENLRDPYHAGLLHLFHATFGLFRATQRGGIKLDDKRQHNLIYNIGGNYDRPAADKEYVGQEKYEQNYKLKDPTLMRGRPDFNDGVANNILAIFPNLAVQQIMNTLATRQIRTNGPSEFELYWTFFGYEDDDEELTRIRLKQANLVGPAGYISMEDGEAACLVQRAVVNEEGCSVIEMGGRGEIGPMETLATEVAIRGFWRRYAGLMSAAPAEGRA